MPDIYLNLRRLSVKVHLRTFNTEDYTVSKLSDAINKRWIEVLGVTAYVGARAASHAVTEIRTALRGTAGGTFAEATTTITIPNG